MAVMAAAPGAGLEDLGHGAATTTRRFVATAVAVGAIVGSSVLLPALPANLAPVDPLLLGAILLGLASTSSGVHSPPKAALRTMAPWLALLAATTVLALTTAGITSWALLSIAKSGYAIALFLGVYALFWSHPVDRRALVWATGLAIVVVTGGLLATWEPPDRAAGTFYHPNYPGHFLAMALIVWWCNGRHLGRIRTVIALVGVGGIVLTASFGAIMMLLVAAGPNVLAWSRRHLWVAAAGASILLIAAISLDGTAPGNSDEELAVTDTLSADRFQRSQEGRIDLWTTALDATIDHPQGLGPMGFRNTPELSGKDAADDGRLAHNLYISYLVDRGPLGLIALLGLGLALWRHAPRGGTARLLLLAIAASNLVRETSHYRHMWIFLAVALTLDHAASRRSRSAP